LRCLGVPLKLGQVSWQTLTGFLVVVLLAYLVPGPDFAVALRAATRGAAVGRVAALGAQTGLCVHMFAAVVGISALLRTLWATRRGQPDVQHKSDRDEMAGSGFRANFTRGVLSNVLNPKAALF
jgi:threonine/homoserine/homoserine lactone efflux protein